MEMRRLEREKTAEAALDDVFFAYDSAILDKSGMRALETNADWLLRHSNTNAQIKGLCDKRDSTAYNLQLRDKRAAAVQEYVTDLGVPAERFTVISYGEVQPLCRVQAESCYRDNRRGHLVGTP